jgi:hypothetical protein
MFFPACHQLNILGRGLTAMNASTICTNKKLLAQLTCGDLSILFSTCGQSVRLRGTRNMWWIRAWVHPYANTMLCNRCGACASTETVVSQGAIVRHNQIHELYLIGHLRSSSLMPSNQLR